MPESIMFFISYAHEDEALWQKLEKQLNALQRQGLIKVWHDREISAGTEWEHEIDKHLKTAHIILLLISPDFIASDYCYSVEMQRALERHERGEARVIPVILRLASWQGTPLGKLQALPTGAKPVTDPSWRNLNRAYMDIVEGIRKVVEELRAKPLNTSSGPALFNNVCRDPEQAQIYMRKGDALSKLDRDEEALAAYEEAIRLDPENASAYLNKGNALGNLHRFEEALVTFEQTIRLDPYDADHHHNKGRALYDLHRYKEALIAHEQAIHLDPYDAHYYDSKRETLAH